MAMFAHIIWHLLIMDLAVCESSWCALCLCEAASRLSLKWPGQGGGD